MQVTNVKVSYLRERQPAQYEKQTPAVEFAAVLEGDDDYALVARKLMFDATTISYNALGYGLPEKIKDALRTGDAHDIEGGEVIVGATLEVPAEDADSEAATETTKKPRGRPAGSKNTRPKKGTKAAEEAAREAATAKAEAVAAAISEVAKAVDESTGADEVPDMDAEVAQATPKDQISTNPEDRVDPDAIPGDDEVPAESLRPRIEALTGGEVPEDDAIAAAEKAAGVESGQTVTPEVIGFTSQDLNTLIGKCLKENKVSLPDAKSITRHFKVARVQELSDTQVLEARSMLEKMMEAKDD